jgi:hypothetical protein
LVNVPICLLQSLINLHIAVDRAKIKQLGS